MPSPRNALPVYGYGHELLYYAALSTVDRLIANGHVVPMGTTHRVRALRAVTGQIELLKQQLPYRGFAFYFNYESDDNPRGVWAFKRIRRTAAPSPAPSAP